MGSNRLERIAKNLYFGEEDRLHALQAFCIEEKSCTISGRIRTEGGSQNLAHG
jgi:hypothetical protein